MSSGGDASRFLSKFLLTLVTCKISKIGHVRFFGTRASTGGLPVRLRRRRLEVPRTRPGSEFTSRTSGIARRLHYALIFGHKRVLESLLRSGADPDLTYRYGPSLLHAIDPAASRPTTGGGAIF
ncbi:unnamed protein product [Trichogramma brassicae]|uniref:Uncharacterized protein n=1 Tax=Trichogramma brassicae TaxID=86971 RepID=A0A6H5HVZ6_9HYME|nr:unnamed protein product [Trichogramma brassicae]